MIRSVTMKVIMHPFTQKASSFSSQFGDGMRDTVWPVKLSIVGEVSQMFIRPKSDHYLSLSLTHLLTHWRSDCRLLNLVPTAWWCRNSYLRLLTFVKSYLKLGENTFKSKVCCKDTNQSLSQPISFWSDRDNVADFLFHILTGSEYCIRGEGEGQILL